MINSATHYFFCDTAICTPRCANGGTCTSPNRCSCRPGWTGSRCTIGIINIADVSVMHALISQNMYVDINECSANHDCQHMCHNTYGSYLCSCPPGFRLHDDGRRCISKWFLRSCYTINLRNNRQSTSLHECFHYSDIIECWSSVTNHCQHNCHDTIGSYTCSCHTGYRLNSNGRTCSGEYNVISKPAVPVPWGTCV